MMSFLSLINQPESKIIGHTDDSEQTYILEDALKECDAYDEDLTRVVQFLQSSVIVERLEKVNQKLPSCKFFLFSMKFSSII
jgi:K+/H+ antiporter YhaU regulatory subunit KhtT